MTLMAVRVQAIVMLFFTEINVSEVPGQFFQINISLIAIDMEYHVYLPILSVLLSSSQAI